jgi:hypothetical protein
VQAVYQNLPQGVLKEYLDLTDAQARAAAAAVTQASAREAADAKELPLAAQYMNEVWGLIHNNTIPAPAAKRASEQETVTGTVLSIVSGRPTNERLSAEEAFGDPRQAVEQVLYAERHGSRDELRLVRLAFRQLPYSRNSRNRRSNANQLAQKLDWRICQMI